MIMILFTLKQCWHVFLSLVFKSFPRDKAFLVFGKYIKKLPHCIFNMFIDF